jgi:hypothetical protein
MPKIRFSIRLMLVAIAVSAALAHFVVVPTWKYYQLPAGTRRVLGKLGMTMTLPASGPTPRDLKDLLKQIKATSVTGPKDPGIPIYLDPIGLEDAGSTVVTPVAVAGGRMTIKAHLDRTLPPLGLDYFVKDGLLTITSAEGARAMLANQPEKARRP